jgi:hypothetical protein
MVEKTLKYSAKDVVAKRFTASASLARAVDTAVALLAGLVSASTTTSFTRPA